MASRLLCRCARLGCRLSSQTPVAAAVRMHLPAGGSSETPRAKGWSWVTERLMCERGAVTGEDPYPTIPVRTQLDELVEKATTPEEVLTAWAQLGGNANQAASSLIRWTQLVLKSKGKFGEQQPELMVDSRLEDMMNTLCQQVRKPHQSDLRDLSGTSSVLLLHFHSLRSRRCGTAIWSMPYGLCGSWVFLPPMRPSAPSRQKFTGEFAGFRTSS